MLKLRGNRFLTAPEGYSTTERSPDGLLMSVCTRGLKPATIYIVLLYIYYLMYGQNGRDFKRYDYYYYGRVFFFRACARFLSLNISLGRILRRNNSVFRIGFVVTSEILK